MTREAYRTGELALTEEEVERVLQNTKTTRDYVLIRLAVATGLRRGDIVRLSWDNINLDERSITFYEQKKRKTRTVYISEVMSQELRRWRAQNPKERYVFPGRSEEKYGRGHVSSRQAYNILQEALKRSGLDERPFHALRATCAKLCQRRGWSVEEAAEHLGDSVRVLQEHYITPSRSEMRERAEEKRLL